MINTKPENSTTGATVIRRVLKMSGLKSIAPPLPAVPSTPKNSRRLPRAVAEGSKAAADFHRV